VRGLSVLLSLAVAAVLAASAAASRAPTRVESGAIQLAVQTFPTVGRKLRVRFVQVRISTVDAHVAAARTDIREPDGSRLGFVEWLLRRGTGKLWRVVWYGTGRPPCTAVAAAVRRDVFGAAGCSK
jgi:hypothetical protein